MGRRSRSSPTLSKPTEAPGPANSTAPNTPNTPNNVATSSALESTDSATSPTPRTTSPTASTSSSTRPRFLSRLSLPLSLPLRNRNRNVADFHIRAEEPHRRYTAGDNVRGAVVIVIVKPIRITHLTVSLHGYVRVLKDPTSVAKAQGTIVLPQNGDSARPRYHGNGLASLFQDEQVLSGEGRLEPGKYEFGFDLMFPDKGLPSSIDFERGTVSYMVTATLTRPTSIAPTSSCERKVMLVENVDVGLLQTPRPRTIFLEPISKRNRRRKSMVLDKSATSPSEINEIGPEQDPIETPTEELREHNVDPRSPIQSDMRSEVSGESGVSNSTSLSRPEVALSQVGTLTSAKQQAVDKKTITATVELLKGGCLPGDPISVRVTVQHTKRVKSLTGVVVTLLRQGKIDSNPPSALFDESLGRDNGSRVDKEDVFPRSRTGLGGLSLTSSGSTSIFRKDLDQNIAPLIIDPNTMQTSVTVTVKLPDDSFPTIKGVPGEMISFKYLVEVVVDLGGRLSNQMQTGPTRSGPYGHGTTDNNAYGPRRGANIADTSQMRHEKGVIAVSMETVVGTSDSSRGRKKSRVSSRSRSIRIFESDEEDMIGREPNYTDDTPLFPSGYFPTHINGSRLQPIPSHPPQPYSQVAPLQPSSPPPQDFSGQYGNGFAHSPAAPSYIPPPEILNEGNLSEKERVRQAETRLLPSQPPEAGPSTVYEEEDIYDAEETPRVPDLHAGFAPSAPSAPDAGPSAPTEDDIELATAPPPGVVEDKQELERRRLLNEASAPPDVPEDMQRRRNDGPSGEVEANTEASAPSAPLVDDYDEFPGYGSSSGPSSNSRRGEAEQLPAYQR
ncbi:environmental pH response protein [Fusarium heterosporum]|uniref:Environmental pH response protein n=1 Tax=Fusarium heterosporum TaxID=42747 RepID=A0A8H5SW07_FUSHE|nr:environmental pH response protein [Fusarium heterosporum]